MIRSYLLLLIAAVTFFIAPLSSTALAEEPVCAAIMPCDDDGRVLAGYDVGACATVYRLRCQSQVNNNLREELVSCEEGRAQTITQLKAALRKTRTQLRVMRAQMRAR